MSMAAPAGTDYAALPWMRNAQFDSFFIFGILGLSLLTGAVVLFEPRLFYPILIIDLWFLGYHHVISTYTRLCFDKKSFQEHWFLIVGLLPIMAVFTIGLVWVFGIWVVVTVYFYWQWWHYTRQSWGISRVYRGKDRDAAYEDGWLDQAIFYALPVAGVLQKSAEGHDQFIGLGFQSVPVPDLVAQGAIYIALGLLAFWAVRRLQAAREGRLAVVHTFYMITHFAIFAVAYVVVENITIGWLMINIWHNAQYILFVWMYNNRRFRDGVDPDARFLSYISQPGRLWLYLVACLAITGVLYWGVLQTMDWLFFAGLSATIVLYQIVNFHHYVVDSMIWKVRKPKVAAILGTHTGRAA